MDPELFSVRLTLHLQSILGMLRALKSEDEGCSSAKCLLLQYFVLGMFWCTVTVSSSDNRFVNELPSMCLSVRVCGGRTASLPVSGDF
jgi:hypothetical protein